MSSLLVKNVERLLCTVGTATLVGGAGYPGQVCLPGAWLQEPPLLHPWVCRGDLSGRALWCNNGDPGLGLGLNDESADGGTPHVESAARTESSQDGMRELENGEMEDTAAGHQDWEWSDSWYGSGWNERWLE